MSRPSFVPGPFHPQLGDVYRYVAWEARRTLFRNLDASILDFADWRSGWYARDEAIVEDVVGYLGRAIASAKRDPDEHGAYLSYRPVFRGLTTEQAETILSIARRSAHRALDWARRRVSVRRVIARMREAIAEYESDENPLISEAEAEVGRQVVRELEGSCEGR